jgi:hypothetical protein
VIMFPSYELLLKWAILSVTYASISVLAACAEDGSFGALMGGSPRNYSPAAEKNIARYKPAAKPSVDLPTVSEVMSKSTSDIEELLGAPHLLREESGAQVWQYADQSCVMLLYFYEDDSNDWRVTHAETRQKNSATGSSANCATAT